MPLPHRPTETARQQVEAAAGLGLPHEQIGALIGIDDKTLRKHYRHELDVGKAKASAQVAKSLFNKATAGNDTTAMIWWTKAQMGWGETNHLTVSRGADAKYLSREDLRQRIADAERAMAGGTDEDGGLLGLGGVYPVHDAGVGAREDPPGDLRADGSSGEKGSGPADAALSTTAREVTDRV